MENILIVDKTVDAGNQFISELSRDDVNITFTCLSLQAQNNIRKNTYDLIILGDRVTEGKVDDVALAIKRSRKNKHTAVVCVGVNLGKVARNIKELSPYAFSATGNDRASTVARVSNYLSVLEKRSNA